MALPSPSSSQAKTIWFCLTVLAIAGALAAGMAGVWLLGRLLNLLAPVLLPLALGGAVAYLLDPLVDRLARRGVPRTRGIVLVFFALAAALCMLIATIVPRLVVEARDLATRIPGYVETASEKLSEWWPQFSQRFAPVPAAPAAVSTDVEGAAPTEVETAPPAGPAMNSAQLSAASGFASRALQWILSQLRHLASWFGLLLGLLLVPVYAFYLLREKKGIQRSWSDYLPLTESPFKREVVWVLSSINDCLVVFIRGQVLVALCSGALLTIGFLALGMEYALVLGLLAGLLGIIPYLGVMISLIPAVIVALVQFGDVLHPALVVAMFAVVNLLEGLVISPKIIGDRVGLHPLTIIIAVMAGTTLLGGILGGVLAIPLTAALRAILNRYVWRRPTIGPGVSASS